MKLKLYKNQRLALMIVLILLFISSIALCIWYQNDYDLKKENYWDLSSKKYMNNTRDQIDKYEPINYGEGIIPTFVNAFLILFCSLFIIGRGSVTSTLLVIILIFIILTMCLSFASSESFIHHKDIGSGKYYSSSTTSNYDETVAFIWASFGINIAAALVGIIGCALKIIANNRIKQARISLKVESIIKERMKDIDHGKDSSLNEIIT